jgi:hypothetical protein
MLSILFVHAPQPEAVRRCNSLRCCSSAGVSRDSRPAGSGEVGTAAVDFSGSVSGAHPTQTVASRDEVICPVELALAA